MTDQSLPKNHAAYLVPGLERGLRALEAMADGPKTANEIAEALGVSRSAAFRILYTLTHLGMAEAADGRHRLGARLIGLGAAALGGRDLLAVAAPELEALRDRTGICAHLAVREGREVVYLAAAHSLGAYRSTVDVGARRPVHAAPMGWVLLEEPLEPLFNGFDWPQATPHTPTGLADLRERIAMARHKGFVLSRGLLSKGGLSISAPVADHTGRVVAGIGVSGPEGAFGGTEQAIAAVRTAARRITEGLGGQP